jgi:cytosine/adenosine deaminase-related metal-dependent hydrolase
MRRFSANYIYCVDQTPLKNGIIEVDDSGKILNVIDTKGELQESRNLEFYNGVIVPGFVNTHCHLELSELKNVVPEKLGLPEFLNKIFQYKKQKKDNSTVKSIHLYDQIMGSNGIVAVGDICNTTISIPIKQKSKINYYSFVEAIGIGENSSEIFYNNNELYRNFLKNNLKASIVPHAPYSVSIELFKLIKDHSEKNRSVISIHNQETESEREMFINKTGSLITKLISLGVNMDKWNASGESSVRTIIPYLPSHSNILFVHNTYTSEEDFDLINQNFENAYWCLCPLSNKYIENRFPNFDLFLNKPEKVTIGTDSLASNKVLSILEEMKVVSENSENVTFDQLIQWATINGAKALKMNNEIGSITIGKTPGLNLITNFNFSKMNLTNKSEVKVLI